MHTKIKQWVSLKWLGCYLVRVYVFLVSVSKPTENINYIEIQYIYFLFRKMYKKVKQ